MDWVRFFRVVAGQALGLGVQYLINHYSPAPLPAPLPVSIGPLIGAGINAACKAQRMKAGNERPQLPFYRFL